MRSPDLSIVIPAHNAQDYLAEAIASCLAQSHKNIEVVVVDDHSKDATPRIAHHYRQKDNRVLWYSLVEGQKSGRGHARNVGCEMARAKYIAVLDSDDVCDKHRAKETLKAFKEKGSCYLYGGAALIDTFSTQIGIVQLVKFDLKNAIEQGVNMIVHSTVAYPKALWEKFPYDEGEYQTIGLDDWHQQIRMAIAEERLEGVEKFFSAYRLRAGQTVKTRDENKVKELKSRILEPLKNEQKESKAEAAA